MSAWPLLVHSPAVPLPDHQWPPTVPLAGVLAAVPVAGAHHLGVQLDSDPRPLVPHLALTVLYQWDVHHLEKCGNNYTRIKMTCFNAFFITHWAVNIHLNAMDPHQVTFTNSYVGSKQL